MQIKRQVPNSTIPKPPGSVDKNKYGEIFATIDGQIYCRDKNGYPKVLLQQQNMQMKQQMRIQLITIQ